MGMYELIFKQNDTDSLQHNASADFLATHAKTSNIKSLHPIAAICIAVRHWLRPWAEGQLRRKTVA